MARRLGAARPGSRLDPGLFVVAAVVAGCSVLGGGLRTSSGPAYCYLDIARGELFLDGTGGTSIHDDFGHSDGKRTMQVAWPQGFTAKAVGGQLEVSNPAGEVVAKTGQSYDLPGAAVADAGGWLACGDAYLR
jgi:hypothetical protein